MGRRYKRNFLTNVVFRIDYDRAELGQLEAFTEKIKPLFPNREQIAGEKGTLNIDFQTGQVKQEAIKMTSWRFSNPEKTKKLEIADEHLFIVYEKYSNSDELLTDVAAIADEVQNRFKINTLKRIGLRYLNELKFPSESKVLNVEKYISSDLLGDVSFAKTTGMGVARVMGRIVLKKGDSLVVLNHGLWNSDFPSEVTENNYILDVDCYSDFPRQTQEVNLVEMVTEYNKAAENAFENSITDEYRKFLDKK